MSGQRYTPEFKSSGSIWCMVWFASQQERPEIRSLFAFT